MFARLTSQVFLPLFVEKNPEISNSDNSNSLRARTEGAFHLSELAGRTSQFENEIGFFLQFFLKNHLFRAYYSGFD